VRVGRGIDGDVLQEPRQQALAVDEGQRTVACGSSVGLGQFCCYNRGTMGAKRRAAVGLGVHSSLYIIASAIRGGSGGEAPAWPSDRTWVTSSLTSKAPPMAI